VWVCGCVFGGGGGTREKQEGDGSVLRIHGGHNPSCLGEHAVVTSGHRLSDTGDVPGVHPPPLQPLLPKSPLPPPHTHHQQQLEPAVCFI
jgi:hypothetical protein